MIKSQSNLAPFSTGFLNPITAGTDWKAICGPGTGTDLAAETELHGIKDQNSINNTNSLYTLYAPF